MFRFSFFCLVAATLMLSGCAASNSEELITEEESATNSADQESVTDDNATNSDYIVAIESGYGNEKSVELLKVVEDKLISFSGAERCYAMPRWVSHDDLTCLVAEEVNDMLSLDRVLSNSNQSGIDPISLPNQGNLFVEDYAWSSGGQIRATMYNDSGEYVITVSENGESDREVFREPIRAQRDGGIFGSDDIGVEFSADNSYLVVTNSYADEELSNTEHSTITTIELPDQTVPRAQGEFARFATVVGEEMYYVGSEGHLMRENLTTGQIEQVSEQKVTHPALSLDGQRVFFSVPGDNYYEFNAVILDIATGDMVTAGNRLIAGEWLSSDRVMAIRLEPCDGCMWGYSAVGVVLINGHTGETLDEYAILDANQIWANTGGATK